MMQSDLNSIEVYVPKYCVQGERIPFYLMWDSSKDITVSINLPNGLSLEEIYNVDSKDLKLEENIHLVKDFEIEGYLGGVVGSKLYEEPSSVKTITFSINYGSDKQEVIERQIELFRPDIKVDDGVGIITITSDKNNRPVTDGGIKIFNYGKGTAIIRINILPDSEIQEGKPEGFEEFKVKFINDLDEAFLVVKKSFPQYSELLESLRTVIKNPLPKEKNELKKVKSAILDLEKAFNSNEEFLTEFFRHAAQAYLKNISIMTDAHSFLAFLKSLGANKIIILDAMKILNVSSKTQKLRAELLVTDLAQNDYPPIKLRPITISTERDFAVPMYQILNTSGKSDG